MPLHLCNISDVMTTMDNDQEVLAASLSVIGAGPYSITISTPGEKDIVIHCNSLTIEQDRRPVIFELGSPRPIEWGPIKTTITTISYPKSSRKTDAPETK